MERETKRFKSGRWLVQDLPEAFWTLPRSAETTMDTIRLKAILLRHDGRIGAQGIMWDIVSKSIGPGVYRVSLKEWDGK